jgi:hypothetical protein
MSMEMHAVHSNMDPSKKDYVVVSYMYEAVKESSSIITKRSRKFVVSWPYGIKAYTRLSDQSPR